MDALIAEAEQEDDEAGLQRMEEEAQQLADLEAVAEEENDEHWDEGVRMKRGGGMVVRLAGSKGARENDLAAASARPVWNSSPPS